MSRLEIEQAAKDVLAGRLGIGMQDAFDLLRRHARDSRSLLRDVAVETGNTSGRNLTEKRH